MSGSTSATPRGCWRTRCALSRRRAGIRSRSTWTAAPSGSVTRSVLQIGRALAGNAPGAYTAGHARAHPRTERRHDGEARGRGRRPPAYRLNTRPGSRPFLPGGGRPDLRERSRPGDCPRARRADGRPRHARIAAGAHGLRRRAGVGRRAQLGAGSGDRLARTPSGCFHVKTHGYRDRAHGSRRRHRARLGHGRRRRRARRGQPDRTRRRRRHGHRLRPDVTAGERIAPSPPHGRCSATVSTPRPSTTSALQGWSRSTRSSAPAARLKAPARARASSSPATA